MTTEEFCEREAVMFEAIADESEVATYHDGMQAGNKEAARRLRQFPEAVRLLRRLVESSCLILGSQTRAEILGTDTDARLDDAEAFLKGLPHAP